MFSAPYPPETRSAFLYARDDELFDDGWSRWISRTMLGIGALERPGEHFPMLEDPAIFAIMLEKVSGEQDGGQTG